VAEQFFNGGGHLNAAGGHLECSIDEACLIARKAINAFAEKLKK
jgi:phosphoesterase RecJ-like protein